MSRRFSKILIANRGEIACRVIRTAKSEGYESVAVYSDADADALHVSLADESVHIGASPVGDSYLDPEKIIAAAKKTGSDAIHPGYGFLSENADFANICKEHGITFIGPSGGSINALGNKAEAKRLMLSADVPCVPGYEGEEQDEAILKAEAEKIGFPLLLKAAAGGGGRGMRAVRSADELSEAISTARAEAQNAFGSGELIIEKLVENARHVEIQIFADEHGNAIHLGERDCSVQRRHQKIIEESPCPVMIDDLREAMGTAAVKAAKAGNYTNAGTVEFLLDDEKNFYFLEINTRLQVEHPVTEAVTGLDLVALQFIIAQGDPLPLTQDDVTLNGHAIEVRLYAEDPANDFVPQIGTVHAWKPATGTGIRVDHGLKNTAEVTPFYDAMIAKVIAYGNTREEACTRMEASLRNTVLLGVQTNRKLLLDILSHEEFTSGNARTHFIDSTGILDVEIPQPDIRTKLIAAVCFIERDAAAVPGSMKGWRSNANATHPVKLEFSGESELLAVAMNGSSYSIIEATGEEQQEEETEPKVWRLEVREFTPEYIEILEDGRSFHLNLAMYANELYLDLGDITYQFTDQTYTPPVTEEEGGDGVLKAPMVGQIVEVNVKEGDTVSKGDVLVVMEAMKMVNNVVAPFDGSIESLKVTAGGQVNTGHVLMIINPADTESE